MRKNLLALIGLALIPIPVFASTSPTLASRISDAWNRTTDRVFCTLLPTVCITPVPPVVTTIIRYQSAPATTTAQSTNDAVAPIATKPAIQAVLGASTYPTVAIAPSIMQRILTVEDVIALIRTHAPSSGSSLSGGVSTIQGSGYDDTRISSEIAQLQTGTVGPWMSSDLDLYRLTGNIGIGTSTPTANLTISSDTATGIRVVGLSTYIDLFSTNASTTQDNRNFRIGTDFNLGNDPDGGTNDTTFSIHRRFDNGNFGAVLMSITTDGRMGIGAQGVPFAQETRLVIAGMNATSSQITLRSARAAIVTGNVLGGVNFTSDDTDFARPGKLIAASIQALASQTHTASAIGTNLAFNVTNSGTTTMTEGMRLLGNGSLGIGTTSPQRLLHVYRNSDGPPVRFEDSNGYCEIDPTSTTWTCTSDERLKRDVVSLSASSSLDKVLQLRPVTFHWNKESDSEARRLGLIAQEVERIYPEFVATDDRGYKSVSYGSLAPVLVSAVQAINDRVLSIEQQLAEIRENHQSALSNVITAIAGVFTKVRVSDGFEVRDIGTGQYVCVRVRFNEFIKTPGDCSSVAGVNEDETIPEPTPTDSASTTESSTESQIVTDESPKADSELTESTTNTIENEVGTSRTTDRE